MKKCGCCGAEKPEDQFFWQNKAKGKLASQCKLCQWADRRRHYRLNRAKYRSNVRKQKQEAVDFISGLKSNRPCADCGKSYPPYVMDFDHRNPSEKKFGIATGILTKGFEDVKAEVQKCDLVCANCHRERTFGPSKRRKAA